MKHIITAIALFAALSNAHAAVQTVEADNGTVYNIIEVTHTRHGGAVATVTSPDEDVEIQFDCLGHMSVYSFGARAFGPIQTVPSRSVAGRIGQIACAEARRQ